MITFTLQWVTISGYEFDSEAKHPRGANETLFHDTATIRSERWGELFMEGT